MEQYAFHSFTGIASYLFQWMQHQNGHDYKYLFYSESVETKSSMLLMFVVFCSFCCSSWCGVAAGALLAKDEPIKPFPNNKTTTVWLCLFTVV